MNDGRRRYIDLPRSRARIDAEIDEELRFDIDMRMRELITKGLSEVAAREQALREFGDIAETRRYCAAVDEHIERRGRLSQWMGDLSADVALALRTMRRMPGFVAVVLSTLAQNISGNKIGADYATVTGELLAASSVALVPLLIIFIVLQKHFINGILAGSVKG